MSPSRAWKRYKTAKPYPDYDTVGDELRARVTPKDIGMTIASGQPYVWLEEINDQTIKEYHA
jgi:hypothetical protein